MAATSAGALPKLPSRTTSAVRSAKKRSIRLSQELELGVGALRDRLKDLASWRLYRALGCEAALSFAVENRKADKAGRPLAFHDHRVGQTKKVPLNQSPLYSEGDSAFAQAKARATRYLGELLPWEFGKIEEERQRQSAEIVQRWTDAMKKFAPKVSKRSS